MTGKSQAAPAAAPAAAGAKVRAKPGGKLRRAIGSMGYSDAAALFRPEPAAIGAGVGFGVGPINGLAAAPPFAWEPDKHLDVVWVQRSDIHTRTRIARIIYCDPMRTAALIQLARPDARGRIGFRFEPTLLAPGWRANYERHRTRTPKAKATARKLKLGGLLIGGSPASVMVFDAPDSERRVARSGARPITPSTHSKPYDPRRSHGRPLGELSAILSRPRAFQKLWTAKKDHRFVVAVDDLRYSHLVSTLMSYAGSGDAALHFSAVQVLRRIIEARTAKRRRPDPLQLLRPQHRVAKPAARTVGRLIDRVRKKYAGQKGAPHVMIMRPASKQAGRTYSTDATVISGGECELSMQFARRMPVFLNTPEGLVSLGHPGIGAQSRRIRDELRRAATPFAPRTATLQQTRGVQHFAVLSAGELRDLVRRNEAQRMLGGRHAELVDLVSSGRYAIGTRRDAAMGRYTVDTGVRGGMSAVRGRGPVSNAAVARARRGLTAARRELHAQAKAHPDTRILLDARAKRLEATARQLASAPHTAGPIAKRLSVQRRMAKNSAVALTQIAEVARGQAGQYPGELEDIRRPFRLALVFADLPQAQQLYAEGRQAARRWGAAADSSAPATPNNNDPNKGKRMNIDALAAIGRIGEPAGALRPRPSSRKALKKAWSGELRASANLTGNTEVADRFLDGMRRFIVRFRAHGLSYRSQIKSLVEALKLRGGKLVKGVGLMGKVPPSVDKLLECDADMSALVQACNGQLHAIEWARGMLPDPRVTTDPGHRAALLAGTLARFESGFKDFEKQRHFNRLRLTEAHTTHALEVIGAGVDAAIMTTKVLFETGVSLLAGGAVTAVLRGGRLAALAARVSRFVKGGLTTLGASARVARLGGAAARTTSIIGGASSAAVATRMAIHKVTVPAMEAVIRGSLKPLRNKTLSWGRADTEQVLFGVVDGIVGVGTNAVEGWIQVRQIRRALAAVPSNQRKAILQQLANELRAGGAAAKTAWEVARGQVARRIAAAAPTGARRLAGGLSKMATAMLVDGMSAAIEGGLKYIASCLSNAEKFDPARMWGEAKMGFILGCSSSLAVDVMSWGLGRVAGTANASAIGGVVRSSAARGPTSRPASAKGARGGKGTKGSKGQKPAMKWGGSTDGDMTGAFGHNGGANEGRRHIAARHRVTRIVTTFVADARFARMFRGEQIGTVDQLTQQLRAYLSQRKADADVALLKLDVGTVGRAMHRSLVSSVRGRQG